LASGTQVSCAGGVTWALAATPPGRSIDISVSTTLPTDSATVVRLAPGNSANPVVMTGPTQYPGRLQPLRAAYLSNSGILVRTGGNAFYERVSFSADRNSLIFRVPATGARDTFGSQTPPPEAEIVGANFDGRQPPFMTFVATGSTRPAIHSSPGPGCPMAVPLAPPPTTAPRAGGR
jgi:hypothetical protein